ncbi:MAG: hypothetical protein AMXMBFR13_47920, partial [Phycisphaerae bacterium]
VAADDGRDRPKREGRRVRLDAEVLKGGSPKQVD